MKIHLTPHDIANSVRMTRELFPGTILIIEGDTDFRVYIRFVDDFHCKLIPSHGKDNAFESLALLEKDNFKGILVIVDADFWRLNGIKLSSKNMLITDAHDLETMILYSEALEKVLSELESSKKVNRLRKSIRDILLECALPIGYLRWISSPTKENLSLDFKELRFKKFLDKKKLIVDITKLIKEVKNKARNYSLDEKDAELKIQNLMESGYDPWQVCSGGDMIQILTVGLKNNFGSRKARTIDSELVSSILRIAYEHAHFRSTKLYESIKGWEKANPKFKILSN